MLRICYIASGNSIHTQRWVNYFARRGHEVHLISSSFAEGYEGFDKRIQMHPLIRLLPQIWKLFGYFSSILWLFQVRKLVEKIEPDILHAHYIGVPAYLGVASGFHPLILSAWGSDILITPKNSLIYKFLAKKTIKRADCIICVSPTLKEEVVKLGVAPEKVEVIPMGVETQKFRPALRSNTLLQELGIADSPVVISTRNLSSIYDVETLIRTIPLVLQQIPETRFIVAGEGKQRAYLESMAQTLGIAYSIRFVGWIAHHELPKYLASADVYVSTSLSDSLGVSTLEARSCGLPVIVGDLPATREWIVDGEDGFIFALRDNKTLAERIVHLLEDEELRKKFGEAGRAIVIERAEYEVEMAKMEQLYREVKS